ncbi:MAG: ABC transporter permease [Candidatus Hodarchaeales archaeon]|jgi:peptide/nickel transport system permease protein
MVTNDSNNNSMDATFEGDVMDSLPTLEHIPAPSRYPPSFLISTLIFFLFFLYWIFNSNIILFSLELTLFDVYINIIIDLIVFLLVLLVIFATIFKKYKLAPLFALILLLYSILGFPTEITSLSILITEINLAVDMITLIMIVFTIIPLLMRKFKIFLFFVILIAFYTFLGTLGVSALVVSFDVFDFSIPLLFLQVFEQLQLLKVQIIGFIAVIVLFVFVLPRLHEFFSLLKLESLSEISKKMFGVLNNKTLAVGIAVVTIFLFIALFANELAPYGFDQRHSDCIRAFCRQSPPEPSHLMGTTTIGWDLFSRVIHGAQIPFKMSIIAASLALVIGIPLGLISGYYSGTADRILNAIMDLLYSFPAVLFAISLSLFLTEIAFIGDDDRIIIVVGFSVGLVYIPTFYKIVRSQVFQIKELPYIEAVKAIGASDRTIQSKYILPNVIASPIALIPFPMVDAILTGAALAFLGIGIQAPTADWGYDLTQGKDLITIAPWWITYPGLMVFLLAFGFALIGDALNDRYNPLLQTIKAVAKAEKADLARQEIIET